MHEVLLGKFLQRGGAPLVGRGVNHNRKLVLESFIIQGLSEIACRKVIVIMCQRDLNTG